MAVSRWCTVRAHRVSRQTACYLTNIDTTCFRPTRGRISLLIPFALVIDALSVHPNYQGQGFGTLLLAAMKQVALQQNSPAIYLVCKDELLSYFEMNEFIEQGIADLGVGNEVNFLMSWKNPFYQEEL